MHRVKLNISQVSANQEKQMINLSRNFVFIFLRKDKQEGELIKVKESKNKLEKILQGYKEVFQ